MIPQNIQWQAWRTFVHELDTKHIYPDIDPRFYYLSRLNKIYRVLYRPLRGYMSYWNQYSIFLRDIFAWIAAVTIYIVVALTAMQVGIATNVLGYSDAFQSASYGFTVFSILRPLVIMGIVVFLFCRIFVYN